MRIKRIRVQNLRAVKDCTLALDSLTALVGPNGAGKSTFLHALVLFQGKMPVSEEDYYDRDTSESIEIKITFDDLSEQAKEQFSKYVRDGELDVVRIIYWEDGRTTSTLHGFSLRNRDFEGILGAPNPTVAHERYRDLLDNPEYSGFPKWSSFPKTKDYLQEWEGKHQDRCVLRHDDGKFFGYSGVGAGYLGRYIRLLYVPAVRDAAGDGKAGKGSALGDLLDLTVNKALAERSDVQNLRGEIKKMYDKAMGPESLPELGDLKADLSRTLDSFARGARVDLDWDPPNPDIAMPRAEARLVEDGYASPVAGAGHGLQRAFIMAALQHLSKAQAAGAQGDPPDEGPSLVLAIEEPELYQHPTRMRHLARLLRSLSDGGIPGVASRMQVVYATHSPHFVFADRIGQVRLVSKSAPAAAGGGKPWTTTVSGTTPAGILEDLKRCGASLKSAGAVDHFLLRAMGPAVSEGFFADIVVVVEGQSDRIMLEAAAKVKGCPLDALGAAVIPCGSKSSMPIPIAMFRRLGIPVYAVWDADDNDEGQKRESEHIASAMGYEGDDWRGKITDRFACLPTDLEGTVRADLKEALGPAPGDQPDLKILGRRRALHGMGKKSSKTLNAQLLAEEISEKQLHLKTLESIAQRIAAMSSSRTLLSKPRHPLYKSGIIASQNKMTYPLLELCSGGKVRNIVELVREISTWLGLSAEQRKVTTASGLNLKVESNMRRALDCLYKANLLDKDNHPDVGKYKDRRERSHYTITEEGERVVADPNITDLTQKRLQKNYPARQKQKEGGGKHA